MRRVAEAGYPWGRTGVELQAAKGNLEIDSLSIRSLPRVLLCVCYWLRTVQVSPTGFMGLGVADFAMSQAFHVEVGAVFQQA